jgi:FkbM family methyltransferase
VLNVAVSATEGTGLMHLLPDTNTGGSGMHRMTKYRTPVQLVKTLTLSQVLNSQGIESVDLMKMDIEGYEY